MGTAKVLISLLCKHLHNLLDVNIKPEHFRLAKFDKIDENSVGYLWQLLHKILSMIVEPNPIFDDNDLPVVLFVKLHFTLLNYDSIEFYCLPSDMSHGSQELLLAFGWLVVSKNVLELILRDRLIASYLRKEFCLPSSQTETTEQGGGDEAKVEMQPMSIDNELNYILWASGSITNNCNAIVEESNSRGKAMCQVHESTLNTCGLPHLSVLESQLLGKPHRFHQYLSNADALVQLVDSHRQWSNKSHMFWEWMGSVLVEKEKCSHAHRLNIDQKNNLIEILNCVRLQAKTYLAISVVTANGNAACLDRELLEMPRFVYSKKKPMELGKWQPESEELVKTLRRESQTKQDTLRRDLHELSLQMEDIEVCGEHDASPK